MITSLNIDYESYFTSLTSRNIKITPNERKILDALFKADALLTTTNLSEASGIHIKNISRYIKSLVGKDLVLKEVIQKGKTRYVYVSLTSRKNDDSFNDESYITSRKKSNENILDKKQKKLDPGQGSLDLKCKADATKESGDKIPYSKNGINLDIADYLTIWEAVGRVKRQLSGNRSSDFKKRLLPLEKRLKKYLTKIGKI